MKRRQFVEKLGVGSAAAALVAGGAVAGTAMAPNAATTGLEAPTAGPEAPVDPKADEQEHDHRPVKGTLATATVSFGQWLTDPPLDRYPNLSPANRNGHRLIPNQVTIKVGGTVNFIIAGLHNVNVYAPGTKPEDIKVAMTRPTTGVPAGVPLINDPDNRVYSGLDPSTLLGAPAPTPTPLRDRVEVVHFPRVGRHLVICGVLGHFVNDRMFGWVRVLPDDEDDQ
jgi:hypothetical protein